MRHKLFMSMAVLAFLLNGSLSWGIEKAKVYDVAVGGSPSIAIDKTGGLHIVYENPVTYTVAKAIRDSKGHLHSVEGSDLVLPGIWYAHSNGDCDQWSPAVNIPGLDAASTQPAIAIEKNGAIDLVWTASNAGQPTDIFFARSTDSGQSWSKPKDISNTPGQSNESAIAIAPDDSIHVVWSDSSRGENHKDIYYSSSKDGGQTWGKGPLLPADNISTSLGQSSQPVIAINTDGSIHVAWLDNTPGETHPDIYYAYRADRDWNQPIDVSHSSRLSSHPGIACGAKGKVYLSWSDNSRKENAADIWCAMASEYGHFGIPMNISSTPGVSNEPAIIAEGSYVVVVWSDTSNEPSKPDVYCRISNDGGSGFSSVIDLSHTLGINRFPCGAIVSDKVLVAWEENDGPHKQIKIASLRLKDIAMGPVLKVAPSINLHNNR